MDKLEEDLEVVDTKMNEKMMIQTIVVDFMELVILKREVFFISEMSTVMRIIASKERAIQTRFEVASMKMVEAN